MNYKKGKKEQDAKERASSAEAATAHLHDYTIHSPVQICHSIVNKSLSTGKSSQVYRSASQSVKDLIHSLVN